MAARGAQFLQRSQIRRVRLDSEAGRNSVAALNSSEYILRHLGVSSGHEAESRLGFFPIGHRSLGQIQWLVRTSGLLPLNSQSMLLGRAWFLL